MYLLPGGWTNFSVHVGCCVHDCLVFVFPDDYSQLTCAATINVNVSWWDTAQIFTKESLSTNSGIGLFNHMKQNDFTVPKHLTIKDVVTFVKFL